MAEPKWSLSQNFTPQFQAMRIELESKIEAAKSKGPASQDVIQELSVLLAQASKALVDATGSIPSYDQKQYELQLKDIEASIESLRLSSASKPKFAFKRKAQLSTTATATSVPIKLEPKEITQASPNNITLSSQSAKHLTRSSLNDHPQQTDLSISDLTDCIVDLLPTSENDLVISALHARNLKNCILLLPSIDGSALLHDLDRCLIVLGSHQFRMHSSQRIDVFLSISSNPIIEHCSQIRFAQYPAKLQLEKKTSSSSFSVQDFSHIRNTPSPHFTFMTPEEKDRIEQRILESRSKLDILACLEELLPQC